MLLGLGLDGDDGHKRVTKGENFVLLGGPKNTHEEMQHKALDFNCELKKRGRRLADIDHDEFNEIADRIGLAVPKRE